MVQVLLIIGLQLAYFFLPRLVYLGRTYIVDAISNTELFIKRLHFLIYLFVNVQCEPLLIDKWLGALSVAII